MPSGLTHSRHASSVLSLPLFRLLVLGVFLFQGVLLGSTKVLNASIDDEYGDSLTGRMPQFLPSNPGIWEGQTCKGCAVRPDPQFAFRSTYNAATYRQETGFVPISFHLEFTGTAIYVFFTLANNCGAGVTTRTETNFTLDAEGPTLFVHEPDMASTDFHFQYLVFSRSGLPHRAHTLDAVMSGPDYPLFMNFDYALYTYDDNPSAASSAVGGPVVPTNTATVSTATASAAPSKATSTLLSDNTSTATSGITSTGPSNITSTEPIKTKSKASSDTKSTAAPSTTSDSADGIVAGSQQPAVAGPIAGGVVGGLAVFAVFLALLLYRRRRRRFSSKVSFAPPDLSANPSGPSPRSATSPSSQSWPSSGPFMWNRRRGMGSSREEEDTSTVTQSTAQVDDPYRSAGRGARNAYSQPPPAYLEEEKESGALLPELQSQYPTQQNQSQSQSESQYIQVVSASSPTVSTAASQSPRQQRQLPSPPSSSRSATLASSTAAQRVQDRSSLVKDPSLQPSSAPPPSDTSSRSPPSSPPPHPAAAPIGIPDATPAAIAALQASIDALTAELRRAGVGEAGVQAALAGLGGVGNSKRGEGGSGGGGVGVGHDEKLPEYESPPTTL